MRRLRAVVPAGHPRVFGATGGLRDRRSSLGDSERRNCGAVPERYATSSKISMLTKCELKLDLAVTSKMEMAAANAALKINSLSLIAL